MAALGAPLARWRDQPSCLWLNADADVSFTHGTYPPRLARVAEALTTHALIGARAGDSVLLQAEPETNFLDLWRQHGFELPAGLLATPGVVLPAALEPLAWNEMAATVAAAGPAFPHPNAAVVRQVNHRAFLLAIEAREEGPAGRSVTNLDELLADVRATLTTASKVVVKGAHGSASTGNLRLTRNDADDPATRVRLAALLERHATAHVEPWFDRVLDLCATGWVDAAGMVVTGRVDRTLHTDVGAPLGTLFAAYDPLVAPWREPMLEAITVVGRELARAGYFGPFCLDGFVFRGADGGLRLRRFVDLNAREPVSWPARRFLTQLDRPGVYLWRLFVPHRLGSAGVRRLRELVATTAAFEPNRARGHALMAPLEVHLADRWMPSPKLAVVLACDSIDEAFDQERLLRHAIDRKPPP